MSYYSDVELITTPEGWKRIQNGVKEANPMAWEHYVADEFAKPINAGKYVLVEIYDVKWYNDEPAVVAFSEALDVLGSDCVPYHFMRMGEAYDDIEQKNYHNYHTHADMPLLTLDREIKVDYVR